MLVSTVRFTDVLRASKTFDDAEQALIKEYANDFDNLFMVSTRYGLIRYANPGFERLLGYNAIEQTALLWTSLIDREHTQPVVDILARMEKPGGDILTDIELMLRHKTGEYVRMRLDIAGWSAQHLAYVRGECEEI